MKRMSESGSMLLNCTKSKKQENKQTIAMCTSINYAK